MYISIKIQLCQVELPYLVNIISLNFIVFALHQTHPKAGLYNLCHAHGTSNLCCAFSVTDSTQFCQLGDSNLINLEATPGLAKGPANHQFALASHLFKTKRQPVSAYQTVAVCHKKIVNTNLTRKD